MIRLQLTVPMATSDVRCMAAIQLQTNTRTDMNRVQRNGHISDMVDQAAAVGCMSSSRHVSIDVCS
jgi:hypothetical protein